EASDLKTLRWERICAPGSSGDWDFLALDQNNPFSLYLPSLTDKNFSAIGRHDLRALVILADPPADNPYGLASFDAQATATSISKALVDIPHDMLGPVENAVGPADKDTLYTQITKQHYTLLHLVAHGLYRNGETILYLLDAEHKVSPLNASDLIKKMKRQRSVSGLPHLAFLSTCESAKPEAEEALGGLAQRLVRELGLPAVVAMTAPVSIATAEELSVAFYQRLHKHGQPDQALTEACAGMQDRPDILVPALYSRLGGRPLFSNQIDRPLTNTEIKYGLERLQSLLPELAPVLLDEFTAQAQILQGTLDTSPDALSKERYEERMKALQAVDDLSNDVLEINFSALALDQSIPAYKVVCPFPGLNAFQTDQEDFFFGRT
ncbi:MAG: CHAT domain-containing protein, partial [Candidatus Electrothrix sp. AR3]|nr:CHAT domain-containing protein [Candidatus Electrothrix sp. AR3]